VVAVLAGGFPGSGQAIYRGTAIDTAPPWAAYITTSSYVLGKIKNPLSKETNCTGTIVGQDWVLTAAHCVFTENANGNSTRTRIPIGDFRVVLGRNDLSKGFIEGRQWTVSKVKVFSGWNPRTHSGDIALLHLHGALPKHARPLSLAPAGLTLPGAPAVDAFGYGNVHETYNKKGKLIGQKPTQRLEETPPGSYIVSATKSVPDEWWMQRVGVSSTLHGDSGGPWVLDSDSSLLVGVQSVGISLRRAADGTGTFAASGAINVAAPAIHSFIVHTAGLPEGKPNTIYRDVRTHASGLLGPDHLLHPIADGGTFECLKARGRRVTSVSHFAWAELPRASSFAACSPTMTFDDVSAGTGVSTHYAASNGVVFYSPQGAYVEDDASNPTSPVLSPGPDFFGQLTISFVSSKNQSDFADSYSVQFDVGYIDDVGAFVTWYSDNGVELGQETIDQFGIQHVVLSSRVGIHSITIDTSEDTAGSAIDNLSF
jgi:hypothetical protein